MPPNIRISGVRIIVWELDPKTLSVIHVTSHEKKNLYSSRKSLVIRHFNSGVSKVHEPWCMFSMLNCKQRFSLHFTQDFRSKFRKWQYTATCYNWNYWTAWKISKRWNVTGQQDWQDGKGWPVNSQISSDIVRWPAVISSPTKWKQSRATQLGKWIVCQQWQF